SRPEAAQVLNTRQLNTHIALCTITCPFHRARTREGSKTMVSRSKSTLVGVSTIALMGLFAGCAGPAESSSDDPDAPVSITYVGYGGDGQEAQIEAWQKSYTAAHPNVTFVNTSPPDVAQVK